MAKRKTMGRLIRERREALGLSQSELARRIGLRPEMVCRYEADAREPTLANTKKLASVLGMSIYS